MGLIYYAIIPMLRNESSITFLLHKPVEQAGIKGVLNHPHPTAIFAESFHKYAGIGSFNSHLMLMGLLP
jgi:hypothetical protein